MSVDQLSVNILAEYGHEVRLNKPGRFKATNAINLLQHGWLCSLISVQMALCQLRVHDPKCVHVGSGEKAAKRLQCNTDFDLRLIFSCAWKGSQSSGDWEVPQATALSLYRQARNTCICS